VLLTKYSWATPANPIGDVCQAFEFSPNPNGEADYFGSFTLQAFAPANLSLSQTSGSPLANLTLAGTGFGPYETVGLYAGSIESPLLGSATTDASGSFTATVREPQHAYGLTGFFALGSTSGDLGAATFSVTPGLAMVPDVVAPGGTTTAEGLGFGAGETVSVYLDEPRLLLGSATANSLGSFAGSNALTVAIPAKASQGIDALIGIGNTTGAIGIGKITVR
jgi:hypothetical protein